MTLGRLTGGANASETGVPRPCLPRLGGAVVHKHRVLPNVRSNKGTCGMLCSVMLFKPHIHLFACTHLSVPNSCDCNALFVYNKHRSIVLFQTRLIVVLCLFTSISLEPTWLRATWIIPCEYLAFQVVGMVMARARLLSCPHHFLTGQTETPLREDWGFVFPQLPMFHEETTTLEKAFTL